VRGHPSKSPFDVFLEIGLDTGLNADGREILDKLLDVLLNGGVLASGEVIIIAVPSPNFSAGDSHLDDGEPPSASSRLARGFTAVGDATNNAL
jgi:hypothetical protein